MYVENLQGNEFIAQITTTNDDEVNGNQSLKGDIEYNKVNSLYINQLDRLWTIYDHEGKGYKIITLNRKGKGNKMTASFTAIPLFFDYMDTNSIFSDNGDHYKFDGSLTAKNAFDKIFKDTPFDYALVDSAESVEWENFSGGESRLETFKRAIERYEYEFEIRGSTVYLKNQVGRDTSIQYRHRFNASDIQQEIDASEQYTAIKGYGYFGEGTNEGASEEDYRNARLKREYTSPLSKILGIRWSPPLVDGRMKVKANMDKRLKQEVENSLKVSVTANIHNLTKQGYPIDKTQVGDRVFLIDDRIGLNEDVRIISQSITRNWKGNIIDASITFGSEGLGKRHQSSINTAAKNINDIFNGRKEMPLSHLDKRVQEISNIINGNTNSVFKYTPNGVIGWNGDDPNYMTKYVGDAIGFSNDGGETYGTAMSADKGIVADYINTGTLRAIVVDSVEIYGSYFESRLADDDYLKITGAYLEARGKYSRTWRGVKTNSDVKIKVDKGHIRFRNDTLDRSLYASEFGISTYIDGEGMDADGYGSSGTVLFWDTEYGKGDKPRGITVNSWGGTAALVSDRHHALVKSRFSTELNSTESYIDIHPMSDEPGLESSANFRFTKSSDRGQGYLVYGYTDKSGFRFIRGGGGKVEVIDSNYNTGGDTSIEAGIGYFNRLGRRGGNDYVHIIGSDFLSVGKDGIGNRVASPSTFRRTYDYGSNVYITTNGTLGRATSASKYKISIENQYSDEKEQLEHSKKVLDLNVTSWFSKSEAEIYAEECRKGERLSEDDFTVRRHVGLTAEDVEAVGLGEHTVKNEHGELEGIQYERLWVHLIPVIKEQQKEINLLKEMIK